MREPEGSTADFLRGLRHELRTPLNHIIGYSELLLDEVAAGGPSRLAPDLDKIHAAGTDLLALVDESLAAAKADAGVVDLTALSEAVRTPLNAVVGYSGMLQEDAVELGREDLVADLRRIEEAGKQVLGLVLAVLDLGRGAAAPVLSPPTAISGPAAPPLPSVEQSADQGSLLVVDDDEANRDMLARRLVRLGYTVALAEHGRAALDRLFFELGLPSQVLATDVDESVLQHARTGLWREDDLEGVPAPVRQQLFEPLSGGRLRVRERFASIIEYRRLDLLRDPYPNRRFHLIACRNVLIYFREADRLGVVQRLVDCLDDRGILFLGSTEVLLNPGMFGLATVSPSIYRKITDER
ncbi:MAG: hypothetical protein K6U87_05960 [Firmicutes bacterium]|nr:hypothetical protein [Bacillota bacterium]